MTWNNRFVSAFFSALILFSAAGVTYLYMTLYEREGAARVIEAVAITGVAPTYNITAGAQVKITMTSRLHQICPFELRWSLIRTSDHVEIVHVVEPVHEAARDETLTGHHIPGNAALGSYTLAMQIYDQCPDRTYISQRSIETAVGQL